MDQVLVTAADDPDNVLLSPSFFVRFEPDVSWMLALMGTYPGLTPSGFFPVSHSHFSGRSDDPLSGDALTLGRFVEGVIHVGEEVVYPLHLEQDAAFDILLSTPVGSGLDPCLLIFDAAGNLVAENDEISDDDNGVDAGFNMLPLPAGDYSVVVSSFNDAGFGLYRLQVARTEYQ